MSLGRYSDIGTARFAIYGKGTALDLANSVPGVAMGENASAGRMCTPAHTA